MTAKAPAPNHDADASAASRSFAIAACVVAVIVFVVAAAILFSGWGEPATAMIIVQGDASVADAVVTVARTTDRGEERYLEAKVEDGDNHRLRFHVPPGAYRVNVALNGRGLLKQEVIAGDRGQVPFISILLHPTTRPGR